VSLIELRIENDFAAFKYEGYKGFSQRTQRKTGKATNSTSF
jgi:hypothetical protein